MRCAMIYDLSKKITYCSAKYINHATSGLQIVASSALNKNSASNYECMCFLAGRRQ